MNLSECEVVTVGREQGNNYLVRRTWCLSGGGDQRE